METLVFFVRLVNWARLARVGSVKVQAEDWPVLVQVGLSGLVEQGLASLITTLGGMTNPALYSERIRVEVEVPKGATVEQQLECVFAECNSYPGHEDLPYEGRSLSVGDWVEGPTTEGTWVVQSMGFKHCKDLPTVPVNAAQLSASR